MFDVSFIASGYKSVLMAKNPNRSAKKITVSEVTPVNLINKSQPSERYLDGLFCSFRSVLLQTTREN